MDGEQTKPALADRLSRARGTTLARLAEEAGVSTATVARVLKGEGYVAEQTRVRVAQILAETGYRPNAIARGLRKQRTLTVGLLLTGIGVNLLFAEMARAVEDEAVRAGYSVLIVNLENDATRERAGVLRLIDSRVDAMIFNHGVSAENVALAVGAGIPVVQVERLVDCDTRAVLVDNTPGITAAMAHLLELGHRRIAFLGADPALYRHFGPRPHSVETDRLSAYRDALTGAGIGVDERLVRLFRYARPAPDEKATAKTTPASGFEQTQALLALAEPPTAVLVTASLMVAGVLQALYQAKLRVPEDISVIGYDGGLAAHFSPPTAAVVTPARAIGEAAMRLALAAIAGDDEPRTLLVTPRLRLRASTGPAPAA